MNQTHPPFWRPDTHADRRPALLARGRIKAALRRWFEARDFIEVEAAILQVSPGNETHLHGFATSLIDDAGLSHPYYLHTSPEFAAQKLLALESHGIVAGVDLGRYEPSRKNQILLAVTELHTRADLDRLVEAFRAS